MELLASSAVWMSKASLVRASGKESFVDLSLSVTSVFQGLEVPGVKISVGMFDLFTGLGAGTFSSGLGGFPL